MKVHYFSAENSEEEYVKKSLSDVTFHTGPLGREEGLSDASAEVLSIFIDSKIGEPEMARFPALKLIATRSTGFDHIDMFAAKARGITVTNVPFYGENTVAEFAFALILSLSRRIIDAHKRVSDVGSFAQQGLKGFDLSRKTIGIVGMGHIGMHMIRIAQGFEMKVIAYDVRQDADLAQKMNFSYASLDELLSSSDIISIHVPYNKATHHLINSENIRNVKRGACLINTARGGVVETEALVLALREGILAGAGLDVLEEEGELAEEDLLLVSPHPNESILRTTLANHWLLKHPRVIVTPHIAFNTEEAVRRIIDTTIDNIKNFAAGTPTNIISP